MARFYISLGSNISPARHIRIALDELFRLFGPLQVSSVFESESVGFSGDNFYNLVVGADSDDDIDTIVKLLRNVEILAGREKHSKKYDSRTLDLDLLTYDKVQCSKPVRLPRGEITRHAFVLQPLAELAPDELHPETGITYAALWGNFDQSSQRLWPIEFDWQPPKHRPKPTGRALVTGGAIRVGAAISNCLADLGYDIVLHFNSSASDAELTALNLRRKGADVTIVKADLSDPQAAAALISELAEPVDVLVNSAAIFPDSDTLDQVEKDWWDPVMNLNLRAPLLLAKHFVAQQSLTHGQIINVIDARLSNNQSDHAIYRLAKGGLQQLTKMQAQHWAPKIRVNALALGAILPPPGAASDHFQRMAEKIPLSRTGDLAAVQEAVRYLIAQEFVTGTILPIDGGEFL